jgi:hypothetical protein
MTFATKVPVHASPHELINVRSAGFPSASPLLRHAMVLARSRTCRHTNSANSRMIGFYTPQRCFKLRWQQHGIVHRHSSRLGRPFTSRPRCDSAFSSGRTKFQIAVGSAGSGRRLSDACDHGTMRALALRRTQLKNTVNPQPTSSQDPGSGTALGRSGEPVWFVPVMIAAASREFDLSAAPDQALQPRCCGALIVDVPPRG